ncbi:MAG: ATP-binding protein [Deltaproteobacteria bacterium]|nr:ATP-binding protein [Deltaproteobacteria bacterium]
MEFKRSTCNILFLRLKEPRRFIQVLTGPRQTGKTTLVRQVMAQLDTPVHYASADEPPIAGGQWLEEQWELGRLKIQPGKEGILVLDEVQKITHWSEGVKRLWDEDTAREIPLKVVLLGSARLHIQTGLTESLAGRFEIIPVSHWSFDEMRKAFGWTLEQYIYFGGYPGSASLVADCQRWSRYIIESLIETTISRDILLMTRVDKPALLRRLFQLGCDYSGQILSYQKMLGQLQDVGNTTTLAHYLDLLSSAGMLTGLMKFSQRRVRQRSSSPKFCVLNTALITAQSPLSLAEAQQDRNFWGRLVESAIGAHLLNSVVGTNIEVFYWRERGMEVDFILWDGKKSVAIEVKSGRRKEVLAGMEAFSDHFHPHRKLLVGGQGMPLEEFLLNSPLRWMQD